MPSPSLGSSLQEPIAILAYWLSLSLCEAVQEQADVTWPAARKTAVWEIEQTWAPMLPHALAAVVNATLELTTLAMHTPPTAVLPAGQASDVRLVAQQA